MDKLAFLLATCPDTQWHDPARAIKLSTQANDLTLRKSPDLLNTLAVAYAAAGEFTNAVATAELAQRQARSAGLQPLTGQLETEIENYRSGKIAPADWKTPPASVIIQK
jgi:spermidine synthase